MVVVGYLITVSSVYFDYFDRIMRVGGGCYGKRQANGSC